MFWFGMVANSITVLAGIIAIGGVVWAVLGRGRMSVTSQMSPGLAPYLHLTVTSTGSNPLHDVELVIGALDRNGFSMRGDGAARRPTLSRGEAIQIIGYEPAGLTFGSPARDGEVRFAIEHEEGFYVTAQWRSPLFPWRRASRTYAWAPQHRFASEQPVELRGRKELAFLRHAQDPSLNPTLPNFTAPPESSARAIVVTDDTFEEMLGNRSAPTVVAFGATWQGQWWEDVKRMLDLFADRHAPRVRVLVVNVDQCPALNERFAVDVLPTFKVFHRTQIIASKEGVTSLPEFEEEMGPLIK